MPTNKGISDHSTKRTARWLDAIRNPWKCQSREELANVRWRTKKLLRIVLPVFDLAPHDSVAIAGRFFQCRCWVSTRITWEGDSALLLVGLGGPVSRPRVH